MHGQGRFFFFFFNCYACWWNAFQALCAELYAEFYLSRDDSPVAGYWLRRSIQSYRTWGARRKVHHLKAKHPALLDLRAGLQVMPIILGQGQVPGSAIRLGAAVGLGPGLASPPSRPPIINSSRGITADSNVLLSKNNNDNNNESTQSLVSSSSPTDIVNRYIGMDTDIKSRNRSTSGIGLDIGVDISAPSIASSSVASSSSSSSRNGDGLIGFHNDGSYPNTISPSSPSLSPLHSGPSSTTSIGNSTTSESSGTGALLRRQVANANEVVLAIGGIGIGMAGLGLGIGVRPMSMPKPIPGGNTHSIGGLGVGSSRSGVGSATGKLSRGINAQLDTQAMMAAAQTIGQEMQLDRLLTTLMTILLQCSGRVG